jgi:hypothetical protein
MMNDFRRLATERQYHAVMFFPGTIATASGQWDKEVFTPFADNLKLVAGAGAGYDHVDIDYLTRIGAYYANSPVAVSEWVESANRELSMRLNTWSKAYCNDCRFAYLANNPSNHTGRDDVAQRSMEQRT